MKVLKFGGSSVGTPERISGVLNIVEAAAQSDRVVVVVSAYQGVTDQLLKLAQIAAQGGGEWQAEFNALSERHHRAAEDLVESTHQTNVAQALEAMLHELEEALRGISLIRECSPRTLDFVASFGERLSAFTIAQALASRGKEGFYVDARDLVVTDSTFTNAKVHLEKTYPFIQDFFKDKSGIGVITGFIGRGEDGSTTTIGRGGSDFSASLFGAGLSADVIEIWTDVDGVMSADPRRVKDAFVIDRMSYEEAIELSHFGAKVIHPHTMVPAMEKEIPILIKNTFNSGAPGTQISKDPSSYVVVGISSIDNIVLMNVEGSGMMGIPGIAERLFGSLAKKRISVIMITQASSEHSICFAIPEKEETLAQQAIEEAFALEIQVGYVHPVQVIREVSILAAVGSNMSGRKGTAGTLFRALGENGVNVIAIAQGLSELNISFIVKRADAEIALNVVHQAFFLSQKKHIHLFCVGVGKIGGELLSQLEQQQEKLKEQFGIDLRVIALANSKNMLVDEEGIALKKWKEMLAQEAESLDLKKLFEAARDSKKSHKIWVDCTSGDEVGDFYPSLLKAHIAIVTPNKKFNARPYPEYRAFRALIRENGGGFYYETNVGAGLPIIGTLQDLLKSGDEILTLEGIFSGTLSYLFNSFNTFNGSMAFSTLVRQAQEKSYTEPDPRDDLSGTDVARKLLILGREMGLPLELAEIEVESLVPGSCSPKDSVEEFYKKLQAEDAAFEQRRKDAEAAGKVLRYVAQIKEGKARVALKSIPLTHPFAALRGSDNIIAMTTRRYSETPLVVQGPGAGPGVTAAGVFADVLRAAHQFA